MNNPRKSVSAIARDIGIPPRTLSNFLKNDAKFAVLKKRQKILFTLLATQVLEQGIERIKEKIKTAKLSEAILTVGILHDRVYGNTLTKELNRKNEKEIHVFYPDNHKVKEKSA